MDMLVSCDWLAGELGATDLRILDATSFLPGTPRDPHAEYLAAHVPGALFLDLSALKDVDDPRPSMVPTNEQFASRMAQLGVDEMDRIVIYDNSPLVSSARAWWLMRLFGARDVAILDGGLAQWIAQGFPTENGEQAPVRAGTFAAARDARQVTTMAEVLANLSSCAAQVVDARGPARFSGADPEPRPGMVSGHIPGSANLPVGTLLDEQGLWKRGAALRETFEDAGVDLDKRLIMSCGSGVTACNLLFGAALLGKHDVTVYDGSWSEWGADPATPKATGTAMSESSGDKANKLGAATRLVQAGRRPEWTGIPGQPGGIVNPPVWRASTILYEDVAHLSSASMNDPHRLYYGRRGTPTGWSLAEAITGMEPEAAGTMLYPSGVAAIMGALLAVVRPGDELLMVDSAYGPTRALCDGLLRDFGVKTIYYDPLIGAGIASLCNDRTRAIFMESPGSLTFEVQDIPAIVGVARERGIVTLLDNTWAMPLLLPGLGLGVDISILACTKYIVGHSDVMLGSVSANAALWSKVRNRGHMLGQMASPDDAWLALRGLRTLDVRISRQGESALALARWLDARPEIASVLHPALPSCPGHAVWARDFKGASGLFAFELDGGGDAARAALIDGLELFGIGYSWGGYESLALPVDPAGLRTATRWAGRGPLVRINVGLEAVADLIADMEQALSLWREAVSG